MKHILNQKIQFLIRVLVFLYLAFSFINWSFNPGDWQAYSRILALIIFCIIAETNN